MLKICTKCKRELSIENFSLRKREYKNKKNFTPLPVCRECNSKLSSEYYKNVKSKRIKYIYRFLNNENEVIYIGKTDALNYRISNHFSNGHLPKECYESVAKIEYLPMKSTTIMNIKELYYINLYKPMYNKDHIVNEPPVIIKDFANDEWLPYNNKDINNLIRNNISDMFFDSSRKITSIFCRKRNLKYLVYIEYINPLDYKNGKKKTQLLKGSFFSEEEARELVSELKTLYSFKV